MANLPATPNTSSAQWLIEAAQAFGPDNAAEWDGWRDYEYLAFVNFLYANFFPDADQDANPSDKVVQLISLYQAYEGGAFVPDGLLLEQLLKAYDEHASTTLKQASRRQLLGQIGSYYRTRTVTQAITDTLQTAPTHLSPEEITTVAHHLTDRLNETTNQQLLTTVATLTKRLVETPDVDPTSATEAIGQLWDSLLQEQQPTHADIIPAIVETVSDQKHKQALYSIISDYRTTSTSSATGATTPTSSPPDRSAITQQWVAIISEAAQTRNISLGDQTIRSLANTLTDRSADIAPALTTDSTAADLSQAVAYSLTAPTSSPSLTAIKAASAAIASSKPLQAALTEIALIADANPGLSPNSLLAQLDTGAILGKSAITQELGTPSTAQPLSFQDQLVQVFAQEITATTPIGTTPITRQLLTPDLIFDLAQTPSGQEGQAGTQTCLTYHLTRPAGAPARVAVAGPDFLTSQPLPNQSKTPTLTVTERGLLATPALLLVLASDRVPETQAAAIKDALTPISPTESRAIAIATAPYLVSILADPGIDPETAALLALSSAAVDLTGQGITFSPVKSVTVIAALTRVGATVAQSPIPSRVSSSLNKEPKSPTTLPSQPVTIVSFSGPIPNTPQAKRVRFSLFGSSPKPPGTAKPSGAQPPQPTFPNTTTLRIGGKTLRFSLWSPLTQTGLTKENSGGLHNIVRGLQITYLTSRRVTATDLNNYIGYLVTHGAPENSTRIVELKKISLLLADFQKNLPSPIVSNPKPRLVRLPFAQSRYVIVNLSNNQPQRSSRRRGQLGTIVPKPRRFQTVLITTSSPLVLSIPIRRFRIAHLFSKLPRLRLFIQSQAERQQTSWQKYLALFSFLPIAGVTATTTTTSSIRPFNFGFRLRREISAVGKSTALRLPLSQAGIALKGLLGSTVKLGLGAVTGVATLGLGFVINMLGIITNGKLDIKHLGLIITAPLILVFVMGMLFFGMMGSFLQGGGVDSSGITTTNTAPMAEGTLKCAAPRHFAEEVICKLSQGSSPCDQSNINRSTWPQTNQCFGKITLHNKTAIKNEMKISVENYDNLQCVGFAKSIANALDVPINLPSGDARDYFLSNYPYTYYDVVPNASSKGKLKKGDFAVWTNPGNGHIAVIIEIAESAAGGVDRIVVAQANGLGNGKIFVSPDLDKGGILVTPGDNTSPDGFLIRKPSAQPSY